MRAPSLPEGLAAEVARTTRDRGSLLVIADYDGTLAPIVSTPMAARLAPSARTSLTSLAARPRVGVAVISGRSVPDMRERLEVPRLAYAGCYGLTIEGPGLAFVHPAAAAARPLLAEVAGELAQELAGLRGVEVEAKDLCVSVHYRRAYPSDLAEVFFQVERVRERHGTQLTTQPGKKVIELLPRISWDKGECALWLRDHWRPDTSREPAIVFLGDDETDERAFEALRGKAITVRVGSGPRRSAALRWVEDVREAHRFLGFLDAELGRSNGSPA
jgi:trehalose-phosphatase